MKKISRRVIAMLLALIMLSGVIGPDNIMTLVAYADDENIETITQGPPTEDVEEVSDDSEETIQTTAAEEDLTASQTADPTESLMPAASQTPAGTESETEAVEAAEPITEAKTEENMASAPEAAAEQATESASGDVTIDTRYAEIKITDGAALNFTPAEIKAGQITLPETEGGSLTVSEAWSFLGSDEAVARLTLKNIPALKEGEKLILAGLSYEWKDKIEREPVGADGYANEDLTFTVNATLYRSDLKLGSWVDVDSAKYFGFALMIFTPEEKTEVGYTFEDADDYVMLLDLLRKNNIETVAVDDAYVTEGDESAIELIDYIGDYMVVPNKHFDEIKLTALTREGESVEIILRYPVPVPYEQTLSVDLPETLDDTELSLSGILPDGADVTVELTDPAMKGENVLMSLDISIADFQPETPILVTLSDPTIAAALASGEELNIVHTYDDGTQELAEILSIENDTIIFKAPHFSQFDLVSSKVESIAAWSGEGIDLAVSGYGVTATETTVATVEGVELLQAYELSSKLVSRVNVALDANLKLGERESVDVYRIEDGALGSVVTDLSHVDSSFAVVRDSGLRQEEKTSGAVSVSGMMPKDATLAAEDVAEQYEVFSPTEGSSADVFAAYDISILSGNGEYEPDTALQVSIAVDTDRPVKVWHLVDGRAVEVEGVTVSDGAVSFMADSFSPYLVTGVLTTTIVASDGNTYRITVTYDETAGIGEDAELRVTELSGEAYNEYLAKTAAALNSSADALAYSQIFNIEIVGKLSGRVYEPLTSVDVTIEAMNAEPEAYLDVVHFGEETEVYSAEEAGTSIHFSTDSFSVYAVVTDTKNPGNEEVFGRRTYYFYYEDDVTPYYFDTDANGEFKINYIIVRNGDTLKNPGTPAPNKEENAGKEFLGWFIKGEDNTETVIGFIAREDYKETLPITDISNTANETVNVYARFSDNKNITFMDEKGTVIVRTDKAAKGATIDLTKDSTDSHYTLYTPQDPNSVFLGWSKTKEQDALHATQLTVGDKDITLYPVIAPACWIEFETESGSGASYEGAKHWPKNQTLRGQQFPVPTWEGYTFAGWYTEKNGGTQISDGQGVVLSNVGDVTGIEVPGIDSEGKLTADITLYARWAPADGTTYHVVIWQQSSLDTPDLADDQKTYDYVAAIPLKGKTDATIARADIPRINAYTALAGTPLTYTDDLGLKDGKPNNATIAAFGPYFEYNANHSDTSVTVAHDGSAVLNLYYDRKVITINFYTGTVTRDAKNDGTDWRGRNPYWLTTRAHWGVNDDGSYCSLVLSSKNNQYPDNNRIPQDYAVWKKLDGTSYSGQIISTEYSNLNGSNARFYTMRGLYGAPLTGWPHWDGKTWYFDLYDGGYSLSLPWNQFELPADPPEGTEAAVKWDLYLIADEEGVKIHYRGESIIWPGVDGNTDGTYYQWFTNNPWVYYHAPVQLDKNGNVVYDANGEPLDLEDGKTYPGYYDADKAQAKDDPTGTYKYTDPKKWKFAKDLTYNEILGDDTYSSTVTVNNTLFNGYELVGYRVVPFGQNPDECEFIPLGGEMKIPADYAKTNGTVAAEIYVYYARVRPHVTLYSDNAGIFDATLPYGLNLSFVKDWSPEIIGVTKEGYSFAYKWYWDSTLTREVDWVNDNITVPDHNTQVYAGWKPKEFVVELDFNGGVSVGNEDATFWPSYNELIKEYANTKREYISYDSVKGYISDNNKNPTQYRYHHFIFVDEDSVYGDYSAATQEAFYSSLHNGVSIGGESTYYAPKKAFYYEGTTTQTYWDVYGTGGYELDGSNYDQTYYDEGTYVKISDLNDSAPKYRLVGWYKVDKSNGTLSKDPFDFINTQVRENITLRAVWIRGGEYTVKYVCTYTDTDGEHTLTYYDAANGRTTADKDAAKKYADQALVVVPKAPDGLPQSAAIRFLGWKINGKTYYPGDTFRLDADTMDSEFDQVVHLEAVFSDTMLKTSITFDGNGGKYVADDAYTHTVYNLLTNSTVPLPTNADFERDGYKLKGWARNREGTGTVFVPGDTVAVGGEPNTLYAVWEETLSITYYHNGQGAGGALTNPDNLVAPQRLKRNENGSYSHIGIDKTTEGVDVTLSNGAGYSRPGYTLVGWSTQSERDPSAWNPEENPTTDYSLGQGLTLTDDLKLYAVWDPSYSITYNYDYGGSGSLTDGGWRKAPGDSNYVAITSITTDGAGNFTTGAIYTKNDKAKLSSGEGFVRSGYVQIGWSTQPERDPSAWNPAANPTTDYSLGQELTLAGDLKLYAVWQRQYTVRYYPNGGGGELTSGGYYVASKSGDTITLRNDGSGKPVPVAVANNVAFNIPAESEITLSDGNGFTRDGYTLVGWSTSADGTRVDYRPGALLDGLNTTGDVLTVDGDKALYAVWKPKLTITYNANGGTGTLRGLQQIEPDSDGNAQFSTGQIYDYNATPTLHSGTLTDGSTLLQKQGYLLTGWNTEADGKGTHYDLGRVEAFAITVDTTLYAEWTPLFKITYDPNGGSGTLTNGGSYVNSDLYGEEVKNLTPDASSTVSGIPAGSEVTLSNGAGFTNYGYAVKGWSTVQGRVIRDFNPSTNPGVDFNIGDKLVLTKDETLYAVWDIAFMFVFDLQGGTWTESEVPDGFQSDDGGRTYYIAVFAGEKVPQPPIDPTKEHYRFDCWSLNNTYNEYAYDFNLPAERNLTLYALYTDSVKVTFKLNGANVVWNETDTEYYVSDGADYVATLNRGYMVNEPAKPSTNPTSADKDLLFLGWSTDENVQGKTDWSGKTSNFAQGTAYTNDLAYIYANLFDFAHTPINEDTTLYAVWSKTVTVTFDLRSITPDQEGTYGSPSEDTNHHDWNNETDGKYVLDTSDGNYQYKVVIPAGDTINKPENDPVFRLRGNYDTYPFLYWTYTDGYNYHETGNWYYSYNIWADPSDVKRYNFADPVNTDLTLYTTWYSDDFTYHTSVSVTKTLTDPVTKNEGSFDFPYTIKTYRYKVARSSFYNGVQGTHETTWSNKPADVSNTITLKPPATEGTVSSATSVPITLNYWAYYDNSYFYFYYEVLEISETVAEEFELKTVSPNGGNTAGFTDIKDESGNIVGKIYNPFNVLGMTTPSGMYMVRTSYTYDIDDTYKNQTGNDYFWRYGNSGNNYFCARYSTRYHVYGSGYSRYEFVGWRTDTSSGYGTADAAPNAIKNGPTITFTNVRKTQDVTITKNVTSTYNSNDTSTTGGAFTFTGTLTGEKGAVVGWDVVNGKTVSTTGDTVTDANGQFTFTLSKDGSQTLKLPVGARLTVNETGVSGANAGTRVSEYKTELVKSDNITHFIPDRHGFLMTVPLSDSAATVTVTNDRRKPSVDVTLVKVREDPLNADNESFIFQITLNDPEENGNPYSYYDMTAGKILTKEEAEASGNRSHYITDIYGTYEFTINKAVDWKQDIKLPPGAQLLITESGETGVTNINNFTAKGSGLNGETQIGLTYQGIVPDSPPAGESRIPITITNTRKSVDVVVTKAFEHGTDSDRDGTHTFTFVATVTTPSGKAIENYHILKGEPYDPEKHGADKTAVTDANGKATFTITPDADITDSSTATIKVPVGAKLTIEESLTTDQAKRYSAVTASGARGSWNGNDKVYHVGVLTGENYIVPLNGDRVTFTNTRAAMTVRISDVLDDPYMKTGTELFTYTIQITDGWTDGNVPSVDENGQIDMVPGAVPKPVEGYTVYGAKATDENGKVTLTLAADSSQEISVPYGAALTVTQASLDKKYLDFANASPYWTSHKTWKVSETEPGTYSAGTPTFDYLPAKAQMGTFTPADFLQYVKYTQQCMEASIGTVTETSYVKFLNQRKVVPVKIMASTVDETNKKREFTFTGTITTPSGDPISNYQLTDALTTNASGYISFTLKDGDSITLNVPAEAVMNGQERNADLYETRISYRGRYSYNDTFPIDWETYIQEQALLKEQGIISPVPEDRIQPDDSITGYGDDYFPWTTVINDNKAYTSDIPPWACEVLFTNTKPYVPITVTKELDDPAYESEDFYFRVQLYQIGGNPDGTDKETALDYQIGGNEDGTDKETALDYWNYTKINTTITVDATGKQVVTNTSETFHTDRIQKVTPVKNTDDDGNVSFTNNTATFYVPLGAKAVITELDPSKVTEGKTHTFTVTDAGNHPVYEGEGETLTAKTEQHAALTSTNGADKGDPRYTTTVKLDSDDPVPGNAGTSGDLPINRALSFTFTNTRKTVPVTIYKVDEDGNELRGSIFTTTQALPNGGGFGKGDSTVYQGELYVGVTYILTETEAPKYYDKVKVEDREKGQIAIAVGADGITFPGAQEGDATVEGDATTGYKVKIRNTRLISDVTVRKTLNDALATGEVTFKFTATLTNNGKPQQNYPIIDDLHKTDEKGEITFTVKVSNGNTQGQVLKVPEGMDLVVTEVLTEEQSPIYQTKVKLNDNPERENQSTVAWNDVDTTSGTITFTNTRRTTTVWVYKTLDDVLEQKDNLTDDDVTFRFTATLYKPDGTTPIAGYAIIDAANQTNADGEITFTLTVHNGETKEQRLQIPVGATIKVEETLNTNQADRYETALRLNGGDPEVVSAKKLENVTTTQNLRFVNRYKAFHLIVTNEVSGMLADLGGSFTYTLSGLQAGKTYNYTLSGAAVTATADANGKITFSLKNGEKLEAYLPKGQEYTVTQAEKLFFSTRVRNGNADWSDYGVVSGSFTVENAGTDYTVVFQNLSVDVAPTGVDLNIAPFIGLFAFGIALLLLRRRKCDDDDDPDGGGDPIRTTAAEGDSPGEFRNRGDPRAGPPEPCRGGACPLPRADNIRPYGNGKRAVGLRALRVGAGPCGPSHAAREISRRAREKFLSRVILTRIRGWPKARGDPKTIPRARNGPIAEGGIA